MASVFVQGSMGARAPMKRRPQRHPGILSPASPDIGGQDSDGSQHRRYSGDDVNRSTFPEAKLGAGCTRQFSMGPVGMISTDRSVGETLSRTVDRVCRH